MNRLRLTDVREPIARVLGTCTTDARVAKYANEAHARLVAKGKWVGTMHRMQVCITGSSCLVWPRQIETIEGWIMCSTPGTIRNQWYEFSGSGPGLLNDAYCSPKQLIDRGTTPTFDQPAVAGTSKLAVLGNAADAGLRILIRGYNGTGTWIRTVDGGSLVDGEYIAITNPATVSANTFSNITSVIKPVTSYPVTVQEYDPTTLAVLKNLAVYEPDETLPIYRSSLVPGIQYINGCGDSSESCCGGGDTQITIIAKLRHIDVVGENDFFLLGNLAALKLEVMAILKEERNLLDESLLYEARAIKELQDELTSFEGESTVAVVRQESNLTWGAGVMNPVTLGYRVY